MYTFVYLLKTDNIIYNYIMNYNSIEELTKSSHTDFNIIYKYLDSEEIFEFEKEQLLVFQEFEEYFNENFKEEKKKIL